MGAPEGARSGGEGNKRGDAGAVTGAWGGGEVLTQRHTTEV